jgi:hypothetical protein
VNNIAVTFKHLSDLIDAAQNHELSSQQIEALETAQKALLIIELLGISIHGEIITVT